MPFSLPIDPPSSRSLTDVMPQVLAALTGSQSWFPPARSAIVVVADGLGRVNLTARAGYARFLVERMTRKDAARTVFPSTTAAALTSLLTGTAPGRHGLVGYSIRIPGTDRAANQLTGWERDGLDPNTWQRSRPIFEREAEAGRPCFVVSRPQYAGTGFTEATARGAQFFGASTVDERLALAQTLADQHEGAVIYVYVPELDVIGHARGSHSDAWAHELEAIDTVVRRWDAGLPAHIGAVMTADHGMVDVSPTGHVLLADGDALLDEIEVMAGEPRMLHLYAAEGAAERIADRWRAAESKRSWVMTRREAMDAGLFGAIDADVEPRIGDVLVAARAAVAYYDDRLVDKKAQRMVGQHGSLTDQERLVPLIRLGAFARS